jgi:hypothetical protein
MFDSFWYCLAPLPNAKVEDFRDPHKLHPQYDSDSALPKTPEQEETGVDPH